MYRPEAPVKAPELILICGMPGAGKSSYVAEHLSHLSATFLSLDRTFAQMRQDYPDLSDDQIASRHWAEATNRLKHDLDHAVARGDNIVYEATNLTIDARKERLDAVQAYHGIPYVTKAVYIHPPEAQQHIDRLVSRGLIERRLGALEKIDHYYQQLALPTREEGFSDVAFIGPEPAHTAFEEYRNPPVFNLSDIQPDGTIKSSGQDKAR